MGVITSNACKVCTTLVSTDSAAFIPSADTGRDCSVAYKLFLNPSGVPALLNALSKSGVGYKIIEISQISQDSRLTTKQMTILKSAMELGLYDFPRRITHGELARRLGISPSTLNEILRRAEKKIVGNFLGGPRAEER